MILWICLVPGGLCAHCVSANQAGVNGVCTVHAIHKWKEHTWAGKNNWCVISAPSLYIIIKLPDQFSQSAFNVKFQTMMTMLRSYTVVSFPYNLRPNIASSLSPSPLAPMASDTSQTGIRATSGEWEPSWNPSRQKGRWPSEFIPCNTENNIDIYYIYTHTHIYLHTHRHTRKTDLILNKIGISIQKL